MKKFVLFFMFVFPLLSYAQITIEHPHCNCIDYIDTIEPDLSGAYERKCGGKLIEKGNFSEGKKVGSWESYSMTGNKIRVFNYDDSGYLNGPVKSFYADGTLKLEGEFSSNSKVGVWTYYNSKGKLQKQGKYESGRPVGIWKVYNKKGRKEEIVYDFNERKYISNNTSLRYFENEELLKNDNKGEWFILYYPDEESEENYQPIENLGLAIDNYVNHLEIPLEFWDTYVSYNFESTLLFENGILSKVEIKEIDAHLDGVTTLPLIIITNEKDKLQRVDHHALSKKLLAFKIKEALFLSGPLKQPSERIILYTPFVVNDIKNRK